MRFCSSLGMESVALSCFHVSLEKSCKCVQLPQRSWLELVLGSAASFRVWPKRAVLLSKWVSFASISYWKKVELQLLYQKKCHCVLNIVLFGNSCFSPVQRVFRYLNGNWSWSLFPLDLITFISYHVWFGSEFHHCYCTLHALPEASAL